MHYQSQTELVIVNLNILELTLNKKQAYIHNIIAHFNPSVRVMDLVSHNKKENQIKNRSVMILSFAT